MPEGREVDIRAIAKLETQMESAARAIQLVQSAVTEIISDQSKFNTELDAVGSTVNELRKSIQGSEHSKGLVADVLLLKTSVDAVGLTVTEIKHALAEQNSRLTKLASVVLGGAGMGGAGLSKLLQVLGQ